MFSTARRNSSNASRWDDKSIACFAAVEGCAVRLLRHPRPLEMDGCVGRRRALQHTAELRRPGVVPPPLAGRDRPIERIPKELVTEVVLPGSEDGIQHVVVDELLDRIVERLDGQVHHPGEDARHERPPEDGASPGHGLRLGRQPSDPRQGRVLERLRHGRVQHGPAVREPLPAERAEEFLDVERDAVGPGVDRVDDVARRRQSGPEDQRVISAVSSRVRRPEADLLGEPLRDEARAPLPKDGPGEGLVAPVGPDEQQRPVTRLARHLGQGLQAEVVGPLEVLERQHRRHIRRRRDRRSP